MRQILVLIALVAFCAVPAYGQTPTVPTGTAFQLVGTHTGVNVDGLTGSGYRCWLDGVKNGADLPPPARNTVTGEVLCLFPAIATVGAHTVSLSAFNAGGESAKATVAFTTVVPLPPIPGPLTNPKILVNGTAVVGGLTVPAQFTFALKANPKTKVATLRLVEIETQ